MNLYFLNFKSYRNYRLEVIIEEFDVMMGTKNACKMHFKIHSKYN